jgi:hypothetical protein
LTPSYQPKARNADLMSSLKQSGEILMASDVDMHVAAQSGNGVNDDASSDYEGDYLDDLLDEGASSSVPFKLCTL